MRLSLKISTSQGFYLEHVRLALSLLVGVVTLFVSSSTHAEAKKKLYAEKKLSVKRGLVPRNTIYCGKNSLSMTEPFFIRRKKAESLASYIARLTTTAETLKSRSSKTRRKKLLEGLAEARSTVQANCPSMVEVPQPFPTQASGAEVFTSVRLPIEVMGREGTKKVVKMTLSANEVAAAKKLYLRIHNLSYEDKVLLSINGGTNISFNNLTVEIEPLAKKFGGIGGGFVTIKTHLPLSLSALKEGTNELAFTFNFSDGISSGFRIIDLNLIDENGGAVLAESRLQREDPALWKPELSSEEDLAAGKKLWLSAGLKDPLTGKAILAKCQHCHTTSGSDLKYFNFSDYSIVARSQFHGLSEHEGRQIASYIRSLNSVAPGRPWNPPFQPGPGMDAAPVAEWSAGAGIDAVLDEDSQMFRHMFPKGVRTEEARPEANMKAREIPVAFQLPDWNNWLPTVHPIDAFGAEAVPGVIDNNCDITTEDLKQASHCGFLRQRARLQKKRDMGGLSILDFSPGQWAYYTRITLREKLPPPTLDEEWTLFDAHRFYSIPQFLMVKQWELIRDFDLEGSAPTLLDPTLRRWIGGQAFATSPRMVGIPKEHLFVRNNTASLHTYLGWIWYHLQLVLNDGNRAQSSNAPIDWGYAFGHIKDFGNTAQLGQTGLMTLWAVKGLQLKNSTTPADGVASWGLRTGFGVLYDIPFTKIYYNVDQQELSKVLTALSESLIDELNLYPKESYFTPLKGGAYATPSAPGPSGSALANNLWRAIPIARYLGVSSTVVDKMSAFAEKMFPPPEGYSWIDLNDTPCQWIYPDARNELSFKRHLIKCDSEKIFIQKQ